MINAIQGWYIVASEPSRKKLESHSEEYLLHSPKKGATSHKIIDGSEPGCGLCWDLTITCMVQLDSYLGQFGYG